MNRSLLRSVIVGIRREDPHRIWERRAPLTPDDVYYLLSQHDNLSVDIEHCDRRVFSDNDYINAGANIQPNLNNAHIILGIKETPLNELVTTPIQAQPRTHLMFSHTTKGQPYNTPLLAHFVNPTSTPPNPTSPRLIDYELLTDHNHGKRTVGFGWFAGVAGVLESLSSMAHSHLQLGIASPFLYTPRPHTHPTLDSLRASLRDIGQRIAEQGTPKALGPFVIGLTGTGNVAKGCLSILAELPIVDVRVEDLHGLVTNPDTDLKKIYLVHAKPKDYLVRLDGHHLGYTREHYYEHPECYQSVFGERVASYLTLFLNGVGWLPAFPRLMTTSQLLSSLERARSLGGARGVNIGDISCDVEGGLEFLTRATTLSEPFYRMDLMGGGSSSGGGGVAAAAIPTPTPTPTPTQPLPTVQIMSVDILPASLPLDASRHFSKAVMPYLENIVGEYSRGVEQQQEQQGQGQEGRGEITAALERATVAREGRLVGRHAWLQGGVDRFYERGAGAGAGVSVPVKEEVVVGGSVVGVGVGAGTGIGIRGDKGIAEGKGTGPGPGILKKKRVLMLGSGMVAGPAVELIAGRGDVQLLIATNSSKEAERFVGEHPTVQYRVVDVQDREVVGGLVGDADVVISLLPAPLHASIAELCIVHGKHLVTASYISPEMRRLHNRALAADVLLLNEIGLDPGIDHCSALALLSDLRKTHKSVVSFTSFCGGLPAPEVAHVPLRYKFSWSPRGVLSAALNSARFRLGGDMFNIPGNDLLKINFPNVPITKEFELEGIANRDSMPYAETYGIQHAQTVLRGTLRYPGFSSLMHSFKSLGLLETQEKIHLDRWISFVPQCLSLLLRLRMNKHGNDNNNNNTITSMASLTSTIAAVVAPAEHQAELYDALAWLSLLPLSSPLLHPPTPMPPLPATPMLPIDIFAYLLSHKLAYAPEERDMVVLSHEIITTPAMSGLSSSSSLPPPQQHLQDGNDGNDSSSSTPMTEKEVHTSTLIAYGTPGGASAMARTVGLPVAIAALGVLDGRIGVRGVQGPHDASVYGRVLGGLEEAGIGMRVSSRRVPMGVGVDTVEGKLMEGVRRMSSVVGSSSWSSSQQEGFVGGAGRKPFMVEQGGMARHSHGHRL